MRSEDVILNDKKYSQPSPFWGWVSVAGQNKISVTNFQTGMQHTVKNNGKQVFANLPVRKNDEIYIEGDFLWGKFYEMLLQEDNQ